MSGPQTTEDPQQDVPDYEDAPVEPILDTLADDEPKQTSSTSDMNRPRPNIKTVTKEDVTNFKLAVVEAFEQITTNDKDTLTMTAYRSLHHTAFFLILFLMRRITKRAEDL